MRARVTLNLKRDIESGTAWWDSDALMMRCIISTVSIGYDPFSRVRVRV